MSTKKLQIIDSLIVEAKNADTLDGKHADEFAAASDVSTLQSLVGDKSVSSQISDAIAGKSDADHDHGNIYYTETEIDNKLDTKSDVGHTHEISELTDLSGASVGHAETADTANAVKWANVTGKPSAYTPAEHSHSISDVTDLQTALDGKVPTSRTVNGKALSANITLSASDVGADASGSASTALTSAKAYTDTEIAEWVGDKTVSAQISSAIANKSDVGHTHTAAEVGADASGSAASALSSAKSYTDTKISDLINSAPTTLDTLGEIATAMEENADVVAALEEAIGTKVANADLTSHTSNKSNPHGVTVAQIGAVPTTRTVNGKALSANITLSASDVGADASGSANTALTNAKAYTDDQIEAMVGDETVADQITAAIASKSDSGHTHDDRYYTESEINTKLSGKSDTSHNHDTVYAAKSHGNHVPATQTANNAKFLRNDNTWQTVTPANIGAAATSHGTHVSYSTTAPVMDGTAAVGSASTVARSDHKHPTDTSRAAASDLAALQELVGDEAVSAQIDEAFDGAITGLSVSGKTITYTKGDGSTGTITTQDTNTTYSAMTGATSSAAGKAGLVPAPAAGKQAQYLRGDGTWATPTNTTYSVASTTANGLMSSTDKSKLDGIATGANKTTVDSALSSTSTNPVQNKVVNSAISNLNTLVGDTAVSTQITNAIAGKSDTGHTHSSYVNQNAFSNVKVGSTTIAADSTTDTLTLVAGSNVTITPDATNDKVTIAATDTVYTHPTTAGNKHIPSGGSSGQILRWSADGTAVWGADNNTTYAVATTSANGLMSSTDKQTLDNLDTLVGDTAVATQISNAVSAKAPTSHASTATTYGIGTGSNYGHVKLSDSTSSTSAATAGIAASPAAVKAAYDLAKGKANASHNHAASNITSGTLAVARGGTGVTSNPSMLTNLGSTSAASVFAASPRPGVTGVLPVANGGTGVSSKVDVLSTLGLNAVTVTGSASTLSMAANTMTKIALASKVAATSDAGYYYKITSGSLEITGSGVYLICGSVYIETTAVAGGTYGAAGCFIKKTDGSGAETELTSATVDFPTAYGRHLAVNTGIKLVCLADGDKLTLYARSSGKAAGKAYPSNGATYLTAIRLCCTDGAI